MFANQRKKKSVAMNGNHFRARFPFRLLPTMLFLVRS